MSRMKHLLILAGAAALATAGPAFAKPDHAKGHGKHGNKAHVVDGRDYYAPGIGGCPPGLAKKNNGCLRPGQAKKLYNIGQRFPLGYGNAWSYNQIPYDLRNRYDLGPNSNYYYGDGYLYRVDPKTRLISEVVSALLR
jgi:hypothetical protein